MNLEKLSCLNFLIYNMEIAAPHSEAVGRVKQINGSEAYRPCQARNDHSGKVSYHHCHDNDYYFPQLYFKLLYLKRRGGNQ